jgi:hypothetical protein
MPRFAETALLLLVASAFPLFAAAAQPGASTSPSNAPVTKDAGKAAEKETMVAKPAADAVARIKDEGLNRSQVMATLSHLTDVIGPRLTGSPGMKWANEWTKTKLAEWGLENAHLEAWGTFGRGWSLTHFSAEVVEPQCIPLIAFPKAWSPGLEGTLTAEVVFLKAKNETELATYKGKLKGTIVLTSPPRAVAARFEPLATRTSDHDLLELANASEAPRGGRRPRTDEFARARLKFLAEEGAALLVDPSEHGDGGTLFVAAASVPGAPSAPRAQRLSAWDKDAPNVPPQMVVAIEHYNRMVRMIEEGLGLKMAVELGVAFHDDDPLAYNTVAEIPGTDLTDEVVMLGGHMDSWHSGTGATDNAAGVAVVMEAVRILRALDLKPRRTVRIALWSGEEQGLRGSRGYVSKHFGRGDPLPSMGGPRAGGSSSAGTPHETSDPAAKKEYEQFSAYFNLDNGTGKIRGVYLQGNEAVRPIFRKWLQPFRDMGASTLSLSNTGGTDHLSFDGIGLPGFQFIQDEIHYSTRTHHSNQDVYDNLLADDMKQAAVIMASFVYDAAMYDQKLPRKAASR